MYKPTSTYRIQFNKHFTFAHLESIIPYLVKLGIGAVYASPVFKAVPGSMHGYDVTDPLSINPEIGTEEELLRISSKLKEHGIGWIQDIVPNHMAFHPGNAWLMNVLEHGKSSAYASFFDITWNEEQHHGKLMLPFLGTSLEEAIAKKELGVKINESGLYLDYAAQHYPLSKRSVDELMAKYTTAEQAVQAVAADPKLLMHVLDAQHYTWCNWKETDERINYRRFFTVNGLICLNMQHEKVFETYHTYIKKLVDNQVFDGLRVDHIDGLYDPAGYLNRLRKLAGENCFITVEKILQCNEELPQWPVQGSTGYDFLGMAGKLLTDESSAQQLTSFYEQLVNDRTPVQQQIAARKSLILHQHMNGELENLNRLFVSLFPEQAQRVEPEVLKKMIGQMLIECPVYRFYTDGVPLQEKETALLNSVFDRLRSSSRKNTFGDVSRWYEAIAVLEDVLLNEPEEKNHAHNSRAHHFFNRLMQFSGPLMAKGVEDTLMYTYNRFIAHNEVGDTPETFSLSTAAFHKKMHDRQQQWPGASNATSTHDTKRGEDVRARLTVLAELNDEWIKQVSSWQSINAPLKQNNIPDASEEYMIYQTLAGIYQADDPALEQRLHEYMRKALREAKTHSSWGTPDEDYEKQVLQFCSALLDRSHGFISPFAAFIETIKPAAERNILTLLLLKFTCPGIPDIYQGTELNDYSLVDPDNRRQVDFEHRQKALDEIAKEPSLNLDRLSEKGHDKLWLTQLLMQERKRNPGLFSKGLYIPLETEGRYKDHVIAYARRYRQSWCVVVAPLHTAGIQKKQKNKTIDWKNTRVVLPAYAPVEWEHLLYDKKGKTQEGILLNEILDAVPVALLRLHDASPDRGAGVLMHITSLPSEFGIGDLGPQARAFVDFLARSGQKYWQLLPLNPTGHESLYSPYSAVSSMAGNPLLISAELLAEQGLLTREQLNQHQVKAAAEVNYETARTHKYQLMGLAWQRFSAGHFTNLKEAFARFCETEAYWLDDFTLYVVLREQYQHSSWNKWPDAYKNRDKQALSEFAAMHKHEMDQVKFRQFIFFKQWSELKAYCDANGITLFGDLPFYMNLDSVDVWANRELFKLDEQGNIKGIAGVPPDYFSETGQLWGMPVFNWNELKKQKYSWWVERLRRNLQLFGLLRLDHFRAFESYWEVPAGETTAKNGKWMEGPRNDFFEAIKKELGQIPFIAEDLGEEMEAVYTFRDQLKLPGMKVLQFAFGENMPHAVDVPHGFTRNFVVYTGTHDNNTTLGWFSNETSKADQERMKLYTGIEVTERNVNEVMMRIAYASVASIAIIPMQDILHLDEKSRMNVPGTAENNWKWRMMPHQLTEKEERMLLGMVQVFGR